MAENDTPQDDKVAPKKKSKWPLILGVLLLLAGGAGGMAYKVLVLDATPAGDEASGEVALADPVYVELRPAFVINLADADSSRFLQVEVDLMSRDPEAPMHVEQHMPAIRHQVVMDLSSRGYTELRSIDGKTTALASIRDRVNRILEDNTGRAGVVEDVYFSSFVMQ